MGTVAKSFERLVRLYGRRNKRGRGPPVLFSQDEVGFVEFSYVLLAWQAATV